MSVEVKTKVQSVKVTEHVLRDVPDAVLRHLGEHRVPQLPAAEGGGPGHSVAGECAENDSGDNSLTRFV